MAELLRSSLLMAAGTSLSRITGFVRNLVIVALLGTTLLGDSYNVGNTMPNIVYNLIIGGALTAVFLPQIVRALKESDGGRAFISKLVTLVLVTLLLITSVAVLTAPLLLDLYAPTFEGREREITLIFMYFCLPQILFYGLFAIFGQIANSRDSFAPMMWAPILNNLVVISIFSLFLVRYQQLDLSKVSDGQVRSLAIATTAGIVAQSMILIPVMRRLGVGFGLDFKWRGFGLGKSIRLAGWTFMFALVTQIGFLITVNLTTRISKEAASIGIEEGLGLTPYQNAYLIFLLPHSIFSISVATAILPSLSRYVQDGEIGEVRDAISRAIRLVGIVAIPATFFFLFFGEMIGKAIFFGISPDDAAFIGRVLSVFSIALLPLALNTIFYRTLNAFENTKLQTFSNLIINATSTLIAFIAYLVLPIESRTLGIAAGFSLSYLIGQFVTYRTLKVYIAHLEHRSYLILYLKLAAISAAIFGFFAMIRRLLPDSEAGFDPGNTLYLLLVLLITSLAYGGIAHRMGVSEVSEVMRIVTGRKRS